MNGAYFNPFTMQPSQKPIEPKAIRQITSIVSALDDLPDGFADEIVKLAESWPQRYAHFEPVSNNDWQIEIRPYTITELSKQPGMPKRTKLHALLKTLPVPEERRRNAAGQLTPEVVQLLVEKLKYPATPAAKEVLE